MVLVTSIRSLPSTCTFREVLSVFVKPPSALFCWEQVAKSRPLAHDEAYLPPSSCQGAGHAILAPAPRPDHLLPLVGLRPRPTHPPTLCRPAARRPLRRPTPDRHHLDPRRRPRRRLPSRLQHHR